MKKENIQIVKYMNDIILLENRLKYLIVIEEYEMAAIIKRWIEELKYVSSNI